MNRPDNILNYFRPRRRRAILAFQFLIWSCAVGGLAFAQGTQPLAINKYFVDDGHGNCVTWDGSDNVCANLAVTVSPDAVPGDYTYELRCNPDIIGGGGDYVRTCCGYGHETTVHVANHTYTIDPDSGIACMTNAGGRGLSHLYLSAVAPANSVHSEGDVGVTINTVYCGGDPITRYVDIPITIGPAYSAVSRKVHGTAGTFDIDLPLSGTRGVECRSGGANHDYSVVFTFGGDISAVDSSAVTSCGQISSTALGPNSNQYTVNLTNVCNGDYITVTLTNVHYSVGSVLASASATMGMLLGDVNSDGLVNVGDTVAVRNQSGSDVTISNFRDDVTADGFINAGDNVVVRNQSGSSLPTSP